MSDWNSEHYLKFKQQRTQPAIDLALHLKDFTPKSIVDIGCGPGNSTAILAKTFPKATILGIDNSLNMINKAKINYPHLKFKLFNLLSLTGKYDLLFSNACLQWLPNHKILIPSLLDKLNVGGILAVQIPMNNNEPLFQIIKNVIAEKTWGLNNIKSPLLKTLFPSDYFNILATCSSSFNIWETTYYHELPNHTSLIDWVKSTRLKPYLDVLSEEKSLLFQQTILNHAQKAYPLSNKGSVILKFRRFFFIAFK